MSLLLQVKLLLNMNINYIIIIKYKNNINSSKFVYKLSNYVIIITSWITPKFESKLYNYNKILKCTNIKIKIIIFIFINIIFILLFI